MPPVRIGTSRQHCAGPGVRLGHRPAYIPAAQPQWATNGHPITTKSTSSSKQGKPAQQAADNAILELHGVLAPSAVALAAQLGSSCSSASAKTLEVDVPDDVFDLLTNPLGLLFHSPALAIGAAVLAMVLFPKLIRIAINYLAVPAIIAMLAWLAISYPHQAADSIYATLEFVKEHPAASSVGVVVAAGVFLGPDLLAGAAVTGVLVLLAAQLGLLQLPQLPQLPRLPGQQFAAKQLEQAGRVFTRRMEEFGESKGAVIDLDRRDSSGSYFYNGSSSSNSAGGQKQQQQQQRQQQQRGDDDAEEEQWEKQRRQRRQQQQQQLVPPAAEKEFPASSAPAPAAAGSGDAGSLPAGLSGLGRSMGAAGSGLLSKFRQALPQALPESPAELQSGLQSGLQRAGEGLGASARSLGSQVQGLKEQVLGSSEVSGLREKAVGAAARVQQAAGQGAGLLRSRVQQLQQQQQQQLGGGKKQSGRGSSSSSDTGGAAGEQSRSDDGAAAAGARDSSRLESILSNS